MNTNFQFPTAADEAGVRDEADFQAVILYNNSESALNALRLVNSVVSESGIELRPQRDIWSFDILAVEEVAAEALASATGAQLIVVAADGDAELPPAVIGWLERWATASVPGTAAIVAVLLHEDKPPAGLSAMSRFLQVLAKHAGQEFFAREFSLRPPSARQDAASLHRRATEASSVLLGILGHSQPAPRWGLNE